MSRLLQASSVVICGKKVFSYTSSSSSRKKKCSNVLLFIVVNALSCMQLKLTETNLSTKHNRLKKKPNGWEADQLAIYKQDRGLKLGSTKKQFLLSGQSGTNAACSNLGL